MNDNPEALVLEYEGENLDKIGEHLPDISSYNHNFYRLPNGTMILMDSNDDNCSDVYVVKGSNKFLVGLQYDNGEFMIGNFS